MALTLTPSPTANPQPSSSLPTSSLPGTALEVFPEEMPESHDHPVDAPAEPDAALAEVAGSGSSVTDVPSPSGIPQSSTAPEVLTGHLDAQEMRRKAEQEEKERKWAQWRANAQAKVFAVVLGDENARRGIDTSFDEDQPRAWRTVAVDSYLKVFTHGQPPADTPLGRDLLRFQVAHRMFNGRGADSDEEFHAELAKASPPMSRPSGCTFRKKKPPAWDGMPG